MTGRSALIGHTGFVGSNLAASRDFDDTYNSSNLPEIAGRHYELAVSAASRADSHRINAEPVSDLHDIDGIIEQLAAASIDKLVLISTVCVYPGGSTPDEDTPVTVEGLLPYGRNRAHLERRLSELFDTLVVRLPQLYGRNLRKGIVHDLLNDYRVEHIIPSARFQYYDLARLWPDIRTALDAGLSSLNVATPPLTSAAVAADVFHRTLPTPEQPRGTEPYTKDMRTRHHALFGGPPGYLQSRRQVLDDLMRFVAAAPSMPEKSNP